MSIRFEPAPATGGGTPTGAAGGDLSGTYPNPTITGLPLSKLATIATARLLGNNVGSAGVPLELTAAQVKTLLALVKGDVGLGNVDNTADASKTFDASAITAGTVATARLGSGTASSTTFLRGDQTYATPAGGSTDNLGLTPTAVKTSAYTAAAGDLVPMDTTSGAVTVTLPTAPADKTVVAIKHVIQGGTNTVTYSCGGADVLNKTGGATSGTLTLLAQSVLLQYKSSTAIWYVVVTDVPLAQLDSRFDAAGAAAAAQTAAIANLDVAQQMAFGG